MSLFLLLRAPRAAEIPKTTLPSQTASLNSCRRNKSMTPIRAKHFLKWNGTCRILLLDHKHRNTRRFFRRCCRSTKEQTICPQPKLLGYKSTQWYRHCFLNWGMFHTDKQPPRHCFIPLPQLLQSQNIPPEPLCQPFLVNRSELRAREWTGGWNSAPVTH